MPDNQELIKLDLKGQRKGYRNDLLGFGVPTEVWKSSWVTIY